MTNKSEMTFRYVNEISVCLSGVFSGILLVIHIEKKDQIFLSHVTTFIVHITFTTFIVHVTTFILHRTTF